MEKYLDEARTEARADERISMLADMLSNGGSEENAKIYFNATDEEIRKAKEFIPIAL